MTATDQQTDAPESIGQAIPNEFAPLGTATTLSAAEIEESRQAAALQLLRGQRRADNERRWNSACPPLLRETDWQHPDLAAYSAQIQRILGYQIGPKGILASGPTGRGKSRSMWQLMRRLGEEGLDCRYWSASDWFTSLQENIRYGRDDARGWVEAVARRHVVFIDDLGQEAIQTSRTEWAEGWFFRFLDIRVGEGLPLFCTTNLTASEIAGRSHGVRANPLVRRLLDVSEPVRFD